MKNNVEKQFGVLINETTGKVEYMSFSDMSKGHLLGKLNRGFLLVDEEGNEVEYCNKKTKNFEYGYLRVPKVCELGERQRKHSNVFQTLVHKLAEFSFLLLDEIHIKLYNKDLYGKIFNYDIEVNDSLLFDTFIPDGVADIKVLNTKNDEVVFNKIVLEYCMYHKCEEDKIRFFKNQDNLLVLEIYLTKLMPKPEKIEAYGFERAFIYNFLNTFRNGYNYNSYIYLGKYVSFKELLTNNSIEIKTIKEDDKENINKLLSYLKGETMKESFNKFKHDLLKFAYIE